MDLDSTYLKLRVIDWVQTLSTNSPLEPTAMSISSNCSAVDDHTMSLSTEERITQLPISVSVGGTPQARQRTAS